jgi:hypothetical protein
MPLYRFHPLSDPDAEPVKVVLFGDAAAGRFALGAQFPSGCDVWQGDRYVGRFHRPADGASEDSTSSHLETPGPVRSPED